MLSSNSVGEVATTKTLAPETTGYAVAIATAATSTANAGFEKEVRPKSIAINRPVEGINRPVEENLAENSNMLDNLDTSGSILDGN